MTPVQWVFLSVIVLKCLDVIYTGKTCAEPEGGGGGMGSGPPPEKIQKYRVP